MKIISDKHINILRPHAITIGKFDGLHLGHMALIKKTIDYAERLNIPSMVFTFHPSPISVLTGIPFEPLLSEEQKIGILAEMGIDILINYPFDRSFANIPPKAFMTLLFEGLGCRALTIGEGLRFGKNRQGECSALVEAGKKYGAIVEIVKIIKLDGEPISSSRIRQAIADNNIPLAERLLGRPIYAPA